MCRRPTARLAADISQEAYDIWSRVHGYIPHRSSPTAQMWRSGEIRISYPDAQSLVGRATQILRGGFLYSAPDVICFLRNVGRQTSGRTSAHQIFDLVVISCAVVNRTGHRSLQQGYSVR